MTELQLSNYGLDRPESGDDVVVPCLSPEEALSGAPEVEEQRFAVPRILGDEQ